MSNGNNTSAVGGAGQPNQNQPAACGATGGGAAGGGAAAPALAVPSRGERVAEHEAGHAVVADHYGWPTTAINIGPGAHQLAQVDWGAFGQAIGNIDWKDPAQRAAWTQTVLNYVDVLVAGHLAEHAIAPVEDLISARLQANQWVMQNPPAGNSDRDRTARFLTYIERCTMAEVLQAEARAGVILAARQEHLKGLAAQLVQHGSLNAAEIAAALGH